MIFAWHLRQPSSIVLLVGWPLWCRTTSGRHLSPAPSTAAAMGTNGRCAIWNGHMTRTSATQHAQPITSTFCGTTTGRQVRYMTGISAGFSHGTDGYGCCVKWASSRILSATTMSAIYSLRVVRLEYVWRHTAPCGRVILLP